MVIENSLTLITEIYEALWVLILGAVAACWVHVLRNWDTFQVDPSFARERKLGSQDPHIVFLIAARYSSPIVQKTIDTIPPNCRINDFDDYEIKVVVDNDRYSLRDAQVIVVPPDYVCSSKYKSRSLNYALQFLPNSQRDWIFHLDEDTLVTSGGIAKIISHIQKGGKPVANGPSLFPCDKEHGLKLFGKLGEAQRHWTFYWLASMLKGGNPLWLNGSNLLIRSDVEHSVGWNFGIAFSEDRRFGYEAHKKFGRGIFGWHGGLTFEQYSASVEGLVKQRRRWAAGAVVNYSYVPQVLQLKVRRLYALMAVVMGAIFCLLGLILGPIIQPSLLPIFYYGMAVTGCLWLARYLLGLHMNLKFSDLPRRERFLHYLGLLLAPVVEITCGLAATVGMISRPTVFDITPKKGSLTAVSPDASTIASPQIRLPISAEPEHQTS